MALEQTLALAKNFQIFTRRNPLINAHIPSLSPPPFRLWSSAAEPNKNRRLSIRGDGGVKCSLDYSSNNNGYYDKLDGAQQFPRPSEIQWKKELCNSVQLIGIVATPVQVKQLNSGKVLAWSRLAVKKSSTDTVW